MKIYKRKSNGDLCMKLRFEVTFTVEEIYYLMKYEDNEFANLGDLKDLKRDKMLKIIKRLVKDNGQGVIPEDFLHNGYEKRMLRLFACCCEQFPELDSTSDYYNE